MTLVFGLEGHEGCKVAANIIHGFDCTVYSVHQLYITMTTKTSNRRLVKQFGASDWYSNSTLIDKKHGRNGLGKDKKVVA